MRFEFFGWRDLKMIKIFPILFTAACFANFPSEVNFGVGSGYRSDTLQYVIDNSSNIEVSKIQLRPLESAEIQGYFKGLYEYIFVQGIANYGWICSSSGKYSNVIDSSLDSVQPSADVSAPFKFKLPHARGHLFDIEGNLGFAIPVWRQNNMRALIEFFGGYSLHRQSIEPGKTTPLTASITDIPLPLAISATEQLSLGRFQNNWWGPSVGFNIDIRSDEYFGFEIGYVYYFLDYTNHFSGKYDIAIQFPGSTANLFPHSQANLSTKSANGQKISGRIDCYLLPWCKVGILGSYLSAATKKRKTVSFHQTDGDEVSSNTLPGKASWQTFDVLLEVTFTFGNRAERLHKAPAYKRD